MSLVEDFKKALYNFHVEENGKFWSLISSFDVIYVEDKDYIRKKIAEFYETKTIPKYERQREDDQEYFENLKSEIDRLYAEPIQEQNFDRELKEIDDIIDQLHRQLCDQKTLRYKLRARRDMAQACPFCECHPNEEQKKFVGELTEALKQIPQDEPLILKYFELGLRRTELIETQKQIAKIKKLKQFRQRCETYLAGPKKRANLKQFLEANFEYNNNNAELDGKLTLPFAPRVSINMTTVNLAGGITMRMGKTSLNLFEHIDPFFNVLGLPFK